MTFFLGREKAYEEKHGLQELQFDFEQFVRSVARNYSGNAKDKFANIEKDDFDFHLSNFFSVCCCMSKTAYQPRIFSEEDGTGVQRKTKVFTSL